MLYSRNSHNTVKQLHFHFLNKLKHFQKRISRLNSNKQETLQGFFQLSSFSTSFRVAWRCIWNTDPFRMSAMASWTYIFQPIQSQAEKRFLGTVNNHYQRSSGMTTSNKQNCFQGGAQGPVFIQQNYCSKIVTPPLCCTPPAKTKPHVHQFTWIHPLPQGSLSRAEWDRGKKRQACYFLCNF